MNYAESCGHQSLVCNCYTLFALCTREACALNLNRDATCVKSLVRSCYSYNS